MMRRANLRVFPYRRSTVRVAIEEYGEAHDWTDAEIDAAMAVAALVTGEKAKTGFGFRGPRPTVKTWPDAVVALIGPRWKVVDGHVLPNDDKLEANDEAVR